MFRFLPREEKYFALFNRQAAAVVEAAQQLARLFEDFENREVHVRKITAIEKACDEITHDIIKKLNQTFITPIDREDIHALAGGLDDIVDSIEYTAVRILLYRIEGPTQFAREMSEVLQRLASEIERGIQSLENDRQKSMQNCHQIHLLESEGDHFHHAALDSLFAEEQNPLTVIKYKELYEQLERTIDRCEDVANVMEAIVLKNS
jgi:predicted phosphate transport protein (TIGR00153 family)